MRGIWAVVDGGMGTYDEVANHWTLDEYMECAEYLRDKASKQQEKADMAQLARRTR